MRATADTNWTFADGALENYMVEAIAPALPKGGPRYYTLGKSGFIKRTGYAASRLFVARNHAGKNTINFSEIVGLERQLRLAIAAIQRFPIAR